MFTSPSVSSAPADAALRPFALARTARAARLIIFAAALFAAALFAAAPFAPRALAQGQRAPVGGLGGGHTIYGEFKIDESKLAKEQTSVNTPRAFVLILLNEPGRIVDRRSVMHGAQFRFTGLRSGTYDISVESGGLPVARFRFVIDSPNNIEQRQDITLAWDGVGGAKGDPKKDVLSAAEYYERPAATRDAFERAGAAIKKKKFSDAAALLRQVVEADPKDHLAWAHLGSAHNSLGDAAAAEQAYERALQLQPDLHGAAVNLGRLYLLDKGDDKKAKAAKAFKAVGVLKAAAEKRADSADAHFFLAEAYLQTGRLTEADTHFRESIRLDPKGKADAHLRLAAIQDAGGKKDKAAVELEQFIAKRPDHPNRRQFEQYVKDNKKN